MTVSKNPTSYKLSLEVENGVNAIGAMQTKSASLGSVRLEAEAEAVGDLMKHEIVNVYVTEKAALENAGE